jgi:CheY-like chemotaxis protein
MRKKICPDSVLVIDDDDDFRGLISTIGELHGVPILEASDCSSGLRVLKQQHSRIKLVVLDYFMPGMDPTVCGAAVIAQAGPEVPVVLVTAAADPGARARELRLSQWLAKPMELSVITDLLVQNPFATGCADEDRSPIS